MGIFTEALNNRIDDETFFTADFTIGNVTKKVGAFPITPADFDAADKAIMEASKSSGAPFQPFRHDPSNFAGMVAMLMRKSYLVVKDEITDTKVFDIGDKALLMRQPFKDVSDMFGDLFKDHLTEILQADDDELRTKKNSKKTA